MRMLDNEAVPRARDRARHRRGSCLLASAASLCAIASIAPAGAEAQTLSDRTAASSAAEDIIVTARRRDERLQDVPVAITAIGAADLDKYAITSVVAVSQLVPSMVVGRQVTGSSASIFLRGVGSSSISSGFDQSVSTVLDGLPMSRGREIFFSQFDLAQIEVLKGPQALFFGKNSTGGLINIRTADPTSNFAAGIKAGHEFNAAETYGEAYVSGPISETLGARIAVRASRMEGAFTNTAVPAVDNYGNPRGPQSSHRGANKMAAGRLTLRWTPRGTMDWTLKLGGTAYKDKGAGDLYERKCGFGRTTPLPTFGLPDPAADCRIDGRGDHATIAAPIARATPYLKANPYTLNHSYYGALTGNLHLGDITLTSITGYYNYKQEQADDIGSSTAGVYIGQLAKYHQFSEELRVASDFDGPLNATAGIFYSKSKVIYNSTAVSLFLPADVNGRYDIFDRDASIDGETLSAFGELRYALLDNLELAAGARWTHDKKDSYIANVYSNLAVRAVFPLRAFLDHFRDDNVSPQATLTWKPNTDLTVYAAYKQGYKAGGYNTSMTIVAASQLADGQFGSETVKGGEVGTRMKLFDRQLGLSLTAYDYRYRDLQVQTSNLATLATIVANAGQLHVRGVEGEFSWIPRQAGGLEFHGSGAYNRATFKDYLASCYTGQTVLGGCNVQPTATGVFTRQDLNGRQAAKAPKIAGRLGTSYPMPVGGGWVLNLSGDISYSGRYNVTDNLRQDAVQKAFARLDAGIRLIRDEDGLEIALFGRNLTNRYVVTSGSEMAGQPAANTGTADGLPPDLNMVVDRPREIYIQLSKKF